MFMADDPAVTKRFGGNVGVAIYAQITRDESERLGLRQVKVVDFNKEIHLDMSNTDDGLHPKYEAHLKMRDMVRQSMGLPKLNQ